MNTRGISLYNMQAA